jgi:hypothetical protein
MLNPIFWLIVIAVTGTVSYLYHPSIELAIGGTVIGTALTALIVWSSSKLVDTKWWIGRVALVSMVAGLMNATALDVLYSIFAAPAGARLTIGFETVAGGVVLTALALLWAFLRPKHKDNNSGGNTKR